MINYLTCSYELRSIETLERSDKMGYILAGCQFTTNFGMFFFEFSFASAAVWFLTMQQFTKINEETIPKTRFTRWKYISHQCELYKFVVIAMKLFKFGLHFSSYAYLTFRKYLSLVIMVLQFFFSASD